MTDFIDAHLTEKGRDFALAVSKLAIDAGVSPGEILTAFGGIAAGLVDSVVTHGRAERGSTTDAAISIFTDSMVRAFEKTAGPGFMQ